MEKTAKTLSDLFPGESGIIKEFTDLEMSVKLMEMGCLKGMFIKKISTAPFNGPIVIKVYPNENLLALRFEEAAEIIISEPDSNRV